MKHQKSLRSGFTLIELLTVILIIGILAAILFPVVATVQTQAAQASSSNAMRQIYLAHKNYQNDGGRTRSMGTGAWAVANPNQASSPADFAKVLAWYTDLNEAGLFFIASAEDVSTLDSIPRVIFEGTGDARTAPDLDAAANEISYSFARLSANTAGTTPLIWTKGLGEGGVASQWPSNSPWGGGGGHILYSAGNVEFFKEIKDGDLRGPDGTAVPTIQQAFTNPARILPGVLPEL